MRFSVNSKTADYIRNNGIYIRGDMVTIRYITGSDYLYSPVVSKKQGLSNRRNRIKRIIREIMRAGEKHYPPGSYLVYFNGKSTYINRNEISRNITFLMENVKKKSEQYKRNL